MQTSGFTLNHIHLYKQRHMMYLFYSSGEINSKDCEKQPKEILGGKTLLWLH